MTDAREQELVTAGSADRRQPDGAGEFLPVVTTVELEAMSTPDLVALSARLARHAHAVLDEVTTRPTQED